MANTSTPRRRRHCSDISGPRHRPRLAHLATLAPALQDRRCLLAEDRKPVRYRHMPIALAKRSATQVTIPFVDNAFLSTLSETELSLSHHFKSIIASSEYLGSIWPHSCAAVSRSVVQLLLRTLTTPEGAKRVLRAPDRARTGRRLHRLTQAPISPLNPRAVRLSP